LVVAPSKISRGDNVTWTDNVEAPDAGLIMQHGVGIDRADGTVALP
jgi:hypothetical protein